MRSGNTGSARSVVPFLQEALTLLPEGTWLRTVRADSGFFDQALLGFLEERKLPCIIVARMTSTLQQRCAGIKDWTKIDEHHDAGEFTVKLFGWTQARRFVVVRERERESKAVAGRKLIDVPGPHLPGVGDQPERGRAGVVAGLQPARVRRAADR